MKKNKLAHGVERPIQTALVVRPVIKEDLRHDLKEVEIRQGTSGHHELVLPDGGIISGTMPIYGPHALDSNNICRDLVEELIHRGFQGETGAILAMGQTGSGKSHLAGTECRRSQDRPCRGDGPWENAVGQYVPRRIFELAAQQQLESFEVQCAMVEVYSQKSHDSVRDLLAMGRPQIDRPAAPLKHLQWFPAPDALELQNKLLEGSDARETSRTVGNNRSSRSHAIFMIQMTQMRREDSGLLQKVTAQLMLVDLAGSEQAAAAVAGSTTFKEGAGINLGLLSLGGIIEDLARGNPPQYNDCALTRILKPALGGNANAVIVGCISPLVAHLEYTKRTLLYISKAGTIKNTVKADVRAIRRVEEERAQEEIAELRAQLERLRLAKAGSTGMPDAVVLSLAEHQQLLQQVESERLRADSLDIMLRHLTAGLAGASTPPPGAAGATTPEGAPAATAAAAAAAEGRGGEAPGVLLPPEPSSSEAAGSQDLGGCPASPPSPVPHGGAPPGGFQRSPTASYHLAMAVMASPVLSVVEGVVAAPGEEEEVEEAAGAGELAGAGFVREACLEKESNLLPEQLDLLKVSLNQEQRSMRRKRAQQAQQQLNVPAGPQRGRALPPPAPPYAETDIRAWARRVAEERTKGAGWQYVVDSLQHELGYLRLRLNSQQPGTGGADVAGGVLQLEAEVAGVEAQLQEAQQAQRAAEAALMGNDAAQLLDWLAGPDRGSAAQQRLAAVLLAELLESRLQARQLERQLFQQRLVGASLELSLRTYNRCLGDVEEELSDAAAEIQVLRMEREEFKQAIEEKMRYVQQAAAAQQALELLHTQMASMEKQLAAAQHAQHVAQQQASTPPRSFSGVLKSWATLGRSPAAMGGATSQSGHSAHQPLPRSRASSLPGSPRVSLTGGGAMGSPRRTWHQSPMSSVSGSPTRHIYGVSPGTSMSGSQPAPAPANLQQSLLGRPGGRASEGYAAAPTDAQGTGIHQDQRRGVGEEGHQSQQEQRAGAGTARQKLWGSLDGEGEGEVGRPATAHLPPGDAPVD